MGYTCVVYEIRRSETFHTWFATLDDSKARARIAARIDRLAAGNPGDVRPVGSGVSELRVDYGPGFRVYYKRTGKIGTCSCAEVPREHKTRILELAIAMAADLKR